MNTMINMLAGAVLFAGVVGFGYCASPQTKDKNDYYVVANIWAPYHDDPINRKIWPEGIGEWEVVKKAVPGYDGHYQPKVPFWGYEMDNDPKVVERWIDVAVDHGINVFLYDWYWYNEGPFLESAINDGFLKAKNNEKMYFYVMWANHDMPMSTLNPHLFTNENNVVWSAKVDWKNWTIIVDRTIKQYFQKPNYFRIDGKPVFAVYFLDELIRTFENAEGVRKALDYFDAEAKKAGFPGVHFQLSGGVWTAEKYVDTVKTMGFSSVVPLTMGGVDRDYIKYGTNSMEIRDRLDKALNIPFFPCVSIAYDESPRFLDQKEERGGRFNRSPQTFAMFLAKAKEWVDNHPDPARPKLLLINAWSEWAEDCYLLPDMKYGFGYLEAVKDVMNGKYDSR